MIPNADMELPYEGAKEMLRVDDVDNKEFLWELLVSIYEELLNPKKEISLWRTLPWITICLLSLVRYSTTQNMLIIY